MKVSLLIIDDHELTANGIAALLLQKFPCQVTVCLNGDSALQKMAAAHFNLALIDARMPGMSGIELIGHLRARYPALKIVGMTGFDEEDTILELIQSGVHGVLFKRSTDADELKRCMEAVLAGKTFYAKELHERLARNELNLSRNPMPLSKREHQVLQLICQGFSTKQIAADLHMSEYTTDGHRKEMLKKTNTKNTAELVAYALRNGLMG
ncbi:MAG: response regulator transcription factor [Cyclobacteriaceae bacterium]|jgi:DNA-binding NarL/FixJ family response regulator|nr:response regulator transcription factor [Cyclobacteriaceae bacterium]